MYKTLRRVSVYTSQNLPVCLCYHLISAGGVLRHHDSSAAPLNSGADRTTFVSRFDSRSLKVGTKYVSGCLFLEQVSCSDVGYVWARVNWDSRSCPR